jgi:hypothetical protein
MRQQAATENRTGGGPFRAAAPVSCPECGSLQWLVGRQVAECAACATPVPRADAAPIGMPRPRLLRRIA